MNQRLMSIAGIFLILMGLLWTGQGLGFIGGSFMSGSATWAVIGPVTAAVGAVLVFNSRRDL